ncbi:MAG: hypothetical protein ACM3YO_08290 [Bacteroidota bacterium]
MRGSVKNWKAIVLAACCPLFVACGAPPSAPETTKPSAAYSRVETTGTAETNEAANSQNALLNNPFVLWVKQTYPKEAARIINDYLSTRTMANSAPKVESERAKLRYQVLETVAWELYKNLAPSLPQGLTPNKRGTAIWVEGVTEQDGHQIAVSFPFLIKMDEWGLVWITVPKGSVKASIQGFDPLARLFGGNIPGRVYDEVKKSLEAEGPKNAAKTPGLAYLPGGIFRVNPGEAFVKM